MKNLLLILRALLTAAALTLVMGASCGGGGGGDGFPEIPGVDPEAEAEPGTGGPNEDALCEVPSP